MWSVEQLPRHYYGRHNTVAKYDYLLSLRAYLLFIEVFYALIAWKMTRRSRTYACIPDWLEYLTIFWNGMNASLAFYVVVLMLPEFQEALGNGWYFTVCKVGNLYTDKFSGYGIYVYCISSIFRMGDVVLMSARGTRPTILHHLYRMVLPLWGLYSFYTAGSIFRISPFLNSITNFLMHAYHSTTDIWPPARAAGRYVAALQIIQCIIVLGSMTSLFAYIADEMPCETNLYALPVHFALVCGFLALAAKLFAEKYVNFGGRNKNKVKGC
ncbi:unnamed protein product [Bursaphelenchus xylophilus]|uniref:(pine wood nematode) hypothetical protein n=1 Tax=Bursaphelenchus xylophilus TaxID=6326 RepID=A0A1I7RME7_BURXY|nr:unnamed protein product [Bursaphelenchus xylophilus]CAG9118420.1 unnamed protein product [Bursaphelenchus xylophilus]